MATTPQKRTKTTWIVLGAVFLLLLVGVIVIAAQRDSEEIGGSLTAGEVSQTR